jgi:hypothetical protein
MGPARVERSGNLDPYFNTEQNMPNNICHPQPLMGAVVPLRQVLATDIGLGEADDCHQAPLLTLLGLTTAFPCKMEDRRLH